MTLVVQRVKCAAVKVGEEVVSRIGKGLLILIGVCTGDTSTVACKLADKCAQLRLFEDDKGKMNLSPVDIGAEILVVSQFTLCADLSRGRRPSFDIAMPPSDAVLIIDDFCRRLGALGLSVYQGRFGAKMAVELVNDGPVTFVITG